MGCCDTGLEKPKEEERKENVEEKGKDSTEEKESNK